MGASDDEFLTLRTLAHKLVEREKLDAVVSLELISRWHSIPVILISRI
jgi:hypothetical protein